MGSTESKADDSGNDVDSIEINKTKNERNTSTNNDLKLLTFDPRSPSANITRTPTQVLKTPVEDTLTSNDIDTIDDPRSPTTEFNRTPIVVTNSTKTESIKLHNKLLDNARLPHFVPTPIKPKYNPRCTNLSEIKAVELSENKRNSFVGLLETNIDFVETDLDAVIQNKSLRREIKDSETPVGDDFTITDKFDKSVAFVPEECRVDSTAFKECIEEVESVSDTDLLPLADHDLSTVDSLSRKLANLIYEDKIQSVQTPTKSSVAEHRTPLFEHNLNTQSQKSIPTLKVSDRPTKLPKSGSKIPVFKDKKIKGKLVQCENTPPIVKNKPAQWAAEDSMII